MAAERYMEMYNGNYERGEPVLSPGTLNLGQHGIKWIRELIPSSQRILGRNGAPAADSDFIARWGALGDFHRKQGMDVGGSTDPCDPNCSGGWAK